MMARFGVWLASTRLGVAASAVIALALIGAVAYMVAHVEVTAQTETIRERVRVVEQSPCRVDPESRACRQSIQELLAALSLQQHCTILHRGLRPGAYRMITRCPQPEGGDRHGRPSPGGQ